LVSPDAIERLPKWALVKGGIASIPSQAPIFSKESRQMTMRMWGLLDSIQILFYFQRLLALTGGRGGIRTHGTLAGTPVFKTGALNHSATLPTVQHQPLDRYKIKDRLVRSGASTWNAGYLLPA
jgi:hypothetical protein